MKVYPIVALLMATIVAVKINDNEPKEKKPEDPLEEAFKPFDKSGNSITRQDWKQSVADSVKKIESEKFGDVKEGEDDDDKDKKDAKEKNERTKDDAAKWKKAQFNRADGLYDKAHPQKIEDKEEAIFADDLKQLLDKEKDSKDGERKEE